MKSLKLAFLSLSAVLLTSSFALAQTGGTPATGGSPTTGGAPSTGSTPAAVEKDIDLPVDKPVLVAPPKPPTPPDPPKDPVDTDKPPTIYGKDLVSETSTIFYIIDVSGSMGWDEGQYTTPDGKTKTGNRLDRAKAELVKSIMSLPKNFKFDALAFDCGIYTWKGSMVPADDANKNAAIGWTMSLQPLGATGTGPAGAAGLSNRANKLVVLLTDGAPNCGAGSGWGDSSDIAAHRTMIKSNNSQKATINVFGIGATGEFKQFCMNVAADSGGSYTDVR